MPPLIAILVVALGGVGLLLLAAPREKKPFVVLGRIVRRRRTPIRIGRPLRGIKLLPVFESGKIEANVAADEGMASMVLGGDIPGGHVAYIVDVVGQGEDVNARGRYRAVIRTGGAGRTEIVFGAIMPEDKSRQLGMAEYFVDATRGTVGFAGFSFQGTDRLMFNVRGVETAGDYGIRVEWRGIELD